MLKNKLGIVFLGFVIGLKSGESQHFAVGGL